MKRDINNSNKQENQKGFTIIEVLLAIIIGSIIVSMALVGFSRLRVTQRDNARRQSAATILSAYTEYYGDVRDAPDEMDDIDSVKDEVEAFGAYDWEDINESDDIIATFSAPKDAGGAAIQSSTDGKIVDQVETGSTGLAAKTGNPDKNLYATDSEAYYSMIVVSKAKCDDTNVGKIDTSRGARDGVAIIYVLESSGRLVCVDA